MVTDDMFTYDMFTDDMIADALLLFMFYRLSFISFFLNLLKNWLIEIA